MISEKILTNAKYYISSRLKTISCIDLSFLVQIEKTVVVFVIYSGALSEEQEEEIQCAYTELIACFDSVFFDNGGLFDLIVIDQKNIGAVMIPNGFKIMLYQSNPLV